MYLYYSPLETKVPMANSPPDLRQPPNVRFTKTRNRTGDGGPTSHVGFLKVHKAGSSTMQNIFFRFGCKHNLTILLPKTGNYFTSISSLNKPSDGSNKYDILAVHTVYKKERFAQVLPEDSVYIGIIRDPLERMVSAAFYYRDIWQIEYLKKIPKDRFIKNLINYPERYDSVVFSFTRNSMGKDFGFSPYLKPLDSTAIEAKLNSLGEEFALVMVMERFDESLVLMRRLLNWSLSDILYLKSNAHRHKPVIISEKEQIKFRTTCFMDYAIYDYFKKIFEEKLSLQQTDFWEEVKHFKSVLSILNNFCGGAGTRLLVEASPGNHSFYVTRKDCKWMSYPELSFIHKLRTSMAYTL